MDAERTEHVLVMALEVSDAVSYARYRAQMTPLLIEHGGRFAYDFEVGRVLKAESPGAYDRVFSIVFPSRAIRDRFFADPAYRAIRAQHFEPAVRRATVIAEGTMVSA